MGYANQKQSSSSSLIALILLLGFLFFAALLVVGVGGYMFLRQARLQQVAHAELARAEVAQVRVQEAQLLLERAQQAAESNFDQIQGMADLQLSGIEQLVVDATAEVKQMTVLIDQNGNIKLDNESVDSDALQAKLKKASASDEYRLSVAIQADKRCQFAHVADVLSVCKQLKISDISVNAKE